MKYDILRQQPTEEKPFIIDSYPYGRLRTIMKVWVESNKRGDRVLRQTQNPKTKVWNKPKASTYNEVMIMGIDKESGHIETAITLSPYYRDNFEENVKIIRESVDLNEFQEKAINGLDNAFKINNAKKIAIEKSGIEYIKTQQYKHKITGEITNRLPCFEMGDYEEYNGTPEEIEEKDKKIENFRKYFKEELEKVGIKTK